MRTYILIFSLMIAGALNAQDYTEYYEPEVDTLYGMDSMYIDSFAMEENLPLADMPDLQAYFYAPLRDGHSSLSFAIPVQNKGSQASKSTTLLLKYQWVNAKGQKKLLNKVVDIPALKAGEMVTLSTNIKDRAFKSDTYANQLSGATVLIIDPKDYVKEGNEGNNIVRSNGIPKMEESYDQGMDGEELVSDEGY